MSVHRLHGQDPLVAHIRGEAEALAERCARAEADAALYQDAFVAMTKLWSMTLRERDHARDLASRLAEYQPVREVPDSLMEAVLGADTGCWYEGPAGS